MLFSLPHTQGQNYIELMINTCNFPKLSDFSIGTTTGLKRGMIEIKLSSYPYSWIAEQFF